MIEKKYNIHLFSFCSTDPEFCIQKVLDTTQKYLLTQF